MAEFKGTKGKWIITYPKGSNGFIYVGEKTNEGSEGRIATCYTVDTSEWNQNITEETKANALLISKAPEMLEMLKYFTAFPDEDFEEDMDKHISFPMTVDARKIKEAKQLIKEATEL